MEKCVSIAGAIFALGFMVFIHELGHFLAARFFGVRVDVFSLGFGPRITGFRRGNTDYRVSILPLGGYVRMAGETPGDERTGAPDEFASKPRWQRVVVLLAGPMMNLLTAVVVLAALFVNYPEPSYYSKPIEIVGVLPGTAADHAGLQAGDRIVAVNGSQNPTWQRAHWEAALALPGSTIPITVERDGNTFNTAVRSGADEFSSFGFAAGPAIVLSVSPEQPADRAGLQVGDRVVSVDGQSVQSFFQFSQVIQEHEDRVADVLIERNGHQMHLTMHPNKVNTPDGVRWMVGASIGHGSTTRSYGVLEASELSLWLNVRFGEEILGVIGELFTSRWSQVLKNVEGPVGMVAESGRAAREGLRSLLLLTTIISVNLGLLNLLPVPILDGGHILMLAVETTLRRDLSMKTKEAFMQVGMVLILILFVIVLYHDIVRLLPHH